MLSLVLRPELSKSRNITQVLLLFEDIRTKDVPGMIISAELLFFKTLLKNGGNANIYTNTPTNDPVFLLMWYLNIY